MSTPSKTTFVPLPWQIPAWRDKASTMLLTGAAGGGKSRLAGEKFHAFMLKYPNATGILGRKDRTAAMRSVVPLMLYTVMGDTNWGAYHKSEGVFEYYNGSLAWVVGVRDESQREGLRSIGKDGSVDIAWFEEANKLTEADDAEITARMRGNAAGWRQKMYSTNPDHPKHWIKTRLMDNKLASVHLSRPEDNPNNPADYIAGLKQLTGIFYNRLYLGQWVQAEGVVYSLFEPSRHLYDGQVKTPHDGRYIITVDFGYTNPFSCSMWRIMDDGSMYQVEQIYRTQRLVEDHCKDIRRMLERREVPIQRIEAWVCDHDAEDRATLERHLGVTTRAAYKGIKDGIEAIQSRLRSDKLHLLNTLLETDPELEKSYKPTCTADEMPAYVWSDKHQDMPVDDNNHGLDECRYAVSYVDKVGRSILHINTKAIIQNYISGRGRVEQPLPWGRS